MERNKEGRLGGIYQHSRGLVRYKGIGMGVCNGNAAKNAQSICMYSMYASAQVTTPSIHPSIYSYLASSYPPPHHKIKKAPTSESQARPSSHQ